MPIFQYQCSDCLEEFEYLIVQSDDQPSCPSCSSQRLEKKVSVFSVGRSQAGSKAVKAAERLASGMNKKAPPVKEHTGCAGSYAKKLLKKYG